MTDILERLDTVWPADFELQPKTTAERYNVISIQRLKGDAADEIQRLRVNEKASIATVRKWAAERVEMVDEIERLRKLATCGCGDEFAEHGTGVCGNCMAGFLSRHVAEIERLRLRDDVLSNHAAGLRAEVCRLNDEIACAKSLRTMLGRRND